MTTQTKSYTIKDGNGRLTTLSIGWASDDPFAGQQAQDLTEALDRLVTDVMANRECQVIHDCVVSPLRSACTN